MIRFKNNVCLCLAAAALSLLLLQSAQAAGVSLFLSPGSQSFSLGDTFSVEVKVAAAGTPINAVQATIYFPPDKLQVIGISREDSALSVWPKEPAFSNQAGQVSLVGGLPHPGTKLTENLITINFKAVGTGEADLSFDKAMVLADDGQGTNILTYLKPAKYAVFEQITLSESVFSVLSLSHPKENEWYINNNPDFYWKAPKETTGISFVLDRLADTMPDMAPEAFSQSKQYANLADGIWYFHLRLADGQGWGKASHYKIQIDTLPPKPFEIVVDNTGDPTNPSPNLYFETQDEVSGLSYYKIKVQDEAFSNLALAQVNPFVLRFDEPGQYQIIVRAVDAAGNNVEANTLLDIEPIETPEITLWPELYLSGEEFFYVEGVSLPGTEVILFLEKDGQEERTWIVKSNEKGEWRLASKDLIKTGAYSLSAKARDERGAQSLVSGKKEIIVSFSGVSLGPWLISSQKLVLALFIIVVVVSLIMVFLAFQTGRKKKKLKRESAEARDAVSLAFADLTEEIKEKIRLFDEQPEFSEKEKKVYEDLKKSLDEAEAFIEKEIVDVEKELE